MFYSCSKRAHTHTHTHAHTHTQSLGQLGRVGLTIGDGSVVVVVNGRRWILDPECVVHVFGQQPEDELSETLWIDTLIPLYSVNH